MSKKFATKKDFDKWLSEKFRPETIEEMLMCITPSDQEIIDALIADGYTDLDDLVEDGHAYQVGSHTNNGWLWEDEADPEYVKRTGSKGNIKRRTIKDARIAAGLSRAEMSRRFEIPIRTLEDWESEKRIPPVWAEKLIIEKLKSMESLSE